MEKKKLLGVTILILVLAVYLVQNPNFSALQLRENLKDKVIVICGASSGIGERIAYKYAAAGAKVVLSARSMDRLANVQTKCSALGASSVHIIPQDFSKLTGIENFRNSVLEIHPNIDTLVLNHAAIPLGPWMSLPNQQAHEFTTRTFNINVLSYIELTRVFLPDLEITSGQIQVTGSVSGWCPFYQAGLYTSTKHAVNGFFYSLQQELLAKESPITLTVFTLGLILTPEMDTLISSETDTALIPDLFKGKVDECADVIVSSALTRPRNVDYPIFSVKSNRFMAYVFPYFHELATFTYGLSYDDIVQTHKRIRKLGDKIGYQLGNK